MSVAESIVMRAPMAQVGCRSACSGVASASSAADQPRNGPPLAVTISASTASGVLAGEQLLQRGVLGVHRQQARAAARERLPHERAARDEALLVGERDVDARLQRGQRRLEPRGADDGVEDDVRAALGGQLRDPLGAGQHAPGEAAARPLGRGRVGEGDRAHAQALGLAQHAVDVARPPRARRRADPDRRSQT